MPTVKGIAGPYRVFFVSFGCHEPVHVHVQREKMVCKFWMEPVRFASNHGFSSTELNSVRRLLLEHRRRIQEAWDGHCGNTD